MKKILLVAAIVIAGLSGCVVEPIGGYHGGHHGGYYGHR